MESFPWFIAFFRCAVNQASGENQQALILVLIGEHWRDWFQDESSEFRAEINSLRDNTWAHRAFVSDLRAWARKNWPDHPQTATWLLFALAHEKPFDQWEGLASYRKLEGLEGIYGIYLHRAQGGGAEDVEITSCLLLPNLKPESARPPHSRALGALMNFLKKLAYWWRLLLRALIGERLVWKRHRELTSHYTHRRQPLLDKAARKTPRRALGAAAYLFTGSAFWLGFLAWALFGEKKVWKRHWAHRLADRLLRWLAWPLAAALLSFLALADPWQYFADDTFIVPAGLAFVILSLLMMFARTAPVFRESQRVKRQRRQWTRFLDRSCVCIIIGEGEELQVIGPSFGVPLFFSLLVALDRDSPAQSHLARQFMDRLKSVSKSWAFTGNIRGDGQIRRVANLKDKIEAARASAFLRHLIVPLQDGSQERQTVEHRVLLAPGEVRASGDSSLHIQPYKGVMPLMQDIGAFRRRGSFWTMMAALVLWGCLIVSASFMLIGLVQLASVPLDPTLRLIIPSAPLKPTDKTCSLVLQIVSEDPAQFGVRVDSDYWASRPAETFSPEQKAPFLGTAIIQSEKLNDPKGSADDLIVELIRPRHFLLWELPPEVIESRALHDLRNSSPGEKAR
jgi:hypothetical protein